MKQSRYLRRTSLLGTTANAGLGYKYYILITVFLFDPSPMQIQPKEMIEGNSTLLAEYIYRTINLLLVSDCAGRHTIDDIFCIQARGHYNPANSNMSVHRRARNKEKNREATNTKKPKSYSRTEKKRAIANCEHN